MKCFACGYADVPTDVENRFYVAMCPKCGAKTYTPLPNAAPQIRVVETVTLHQQIATKDARIKQLETGISKLIDTCKCRFDKSVTPASTAKNL
jgi:hypothetical protein